MADRPADEPERDPAAGTAPGDDTDAFASPLGGLAGLARKLRGSQPDDEMRRSVDTIVPDGPDFIPYVINFATLTVLSASIAALGLLGDSGAVVIGAMLVAPLMVPITAASAALVLAHNRNLIRALALVAAGTVLAIATGWLVATIASSDISSTAELPHEVATRTFPGLIDLGVAIAAGAAAGYITPRRSINSALPGVGIAVALVPPLAVVGITAQAGLTTEAGNALLLFLTNLAAIVFTAALMLALAGFRPAEEQGRRRIAHRLLFTLATVAVVAVPLTWHTTETIRQRDLERDILASIGEWDGDARVVDMTADLSGGDATIVLEVVGPAESPRAWELAALIGERTGFDVDLELMYEINQRFQVSSR